MNSPLILWIVGFFFCSWCLFRALTTGNIDNEDSEYNMVAQPIRFWLTFVFEIGLLIFCAAEIAHGLGLCGNPGDALMAAIGSSGSR